MPLIPFPNVPNVSGVPDLNRAVIGIGVRTGITQKIQGLDKFGLINKFAGPKWSLVNKSGTEVLKPDSVISLDWRGEHAVATYPIENGNFAAYNKVAMPYDLRVVMTFSGSSANSVLGVFLPGFKETKKQSLQKINNLLKDTSLYDFITPDATYINLNLRGYDYSRTSKSGVSLLIIEMTFIQVMTAVSNKTKTAKAPEGNKTSLLGSVTPKIPSVGQLASLVPGYSAVSGLVNTASNAVSGATSLVKFFS